MQGLPAGPSKPWSRANTFELSALRGPYSNLHVPAVPQTDRTFALLQVLSGLAPRRNTAQQVKIGKTPRAVLLRGGAYRMIWLLRYDVQYTDEPTA